MVKLKVNIYLGTICSGLINMGKHYIKKAIQPCKEMLQLPEKKVALFFFS
jgi:hypothetical protein